MALLTDSIEISAPVERTFAYLTDVERIPEWLPNVVGAQRVSAIRAGPGAEIVVAIEVAGTQRRGRCRVEESEPPNRLVLTSTVDIGVTSTISFDLAANGRQTRLAAIVEYTLTGGGLGGLLASLFADRVARRDTRAALRNLKARIEAEPGERTPPVTHAVP